MTDVLVITSLYTLGTKIIHNQLERNGFSVVDSIITENTIELITKHHPKILSINWVYDEITYDFIMDILPEIKRKYPDIKTVFGGYTSTYDWQHLQNYWCCDYIVGGEADDSVVKCCKDIIDGKNIDKLAYLKTELPDLSKYDYENNIMETENELIFETARSCVNAMTNRCWYCSQFQNPYRILDIEKIKAALQHRMDKAGKKKSLIIVTPETLPNTINELWNTFHVPMWCYVIPQHFKSISDDVEGCEFFTGYDIYEDKSLRCNPTKEYLDDIVRVSQKNAVCFGSVVLDGVPEVTKKEIERVKALSKNIRVEYNSFVNYPGVNNEPLKEDIYAKKSKIETYKPLESDSNEDYEITVNGVSDLNYDNLETALDKYKVEKYSYKRYDFLSSLEIEVLNVYNIEGIYSFLVKEEYVPKLEKLCIVQKIDRQNNLYKCIFKKDW